MLIALRMEGSLLQGHLRAREYMHVHKYLHLCFLIFIEILKFQYFYSKFITRFMLIFFLYIFVYHFLTVRRLAPITLNQLTYLINPLGCFQSLPVMASSLSPTWVPSSSCLGFDTPHQAGGVARFSS